MHSAPARKLGSDHAWRGWSTASAALARVPMPSHNVYLDRLLGAVAHGDADRDQAVLAREQNRASGIE